MWIFYYNCPKALGFDYVNSPTKFELQLLTQLQGVQTLSVKSNLLILPIQSWSIYDSLGSNWPQDKGNLHTGCKNHIGT